MSKGGDSHLILILRRLLGRLLGGLLGGRHLARKPRPANVALLGELLAQVLVAFRLDLSLVRVASVPVIDGVHDVHPLDHLTERGDALLVHHRAVLEVDKHLGGMRVRDLGSGM